MATFEEKRKRVGDGPREVGVRSGGRRVVSRVAELMTRKRTVSPRKSKGKKPILRIES